MAVYMTPAAPRTARAIATGLIPCQGALKMAATSNTDPKWTIVGVANALPARSASLVTGKSAMRVITTNCNPINAPAEDPTMT
jgi:hypothetical protein